uniref:ATP synthase complex subunit 8 n=1 Tax=Lissemys scutata TaxID=227466 RepID=A0A096VGS9_9SAUR|nr:ATP synthase F0 subunit 8 [Lissemys scutata]AFC17510.1 ATP synthase F0 subunit 8 [Lissemys scutata]
MPQLNPNPWLFTLLITWLAFTLIYQPKTLSYLQTNNNVTLKTNTPTKHWNWPWI